MIVCNITNGSWTVRTSADVCSKPIAMAIRRLMEAMHGSKNRRTCWYRHAYITQHVEHVYISAHHI